MLLVQHESTRACLMGLCSSLVEVSSLAFLPRGISTIMLTMPCSDISHHLTPTAFRWGPHVLLVHPQGDIVPGRDLLAAHLCCR